ncbi:MAG: hypothetical protein QXM46_03625 [Candidatus Hadarchaeales archaeon]
MKNERMGIATSVLLVIIVIVGAAAAGAYVVLTREGGESGGETGGGGGGVGSASSLSYTVDVTPQGYETVTYTFKIKDIGQATVRYRIEWTSGGFPTVLIVNRAENKVWMRVGEMEWMDMSSQMNWQSYTASAEQYRTRLQNWVSGDYTYTDPNGTRVRIYNIQVNPSLPDSLFTPD